MINSTFHFEEFLNNVASGHDKDVVDPDKNLIYTHRKARQKQFAQSDVMPEESTVKFPSAGWSTSLQRMQRWIYIFLNMEKTVTDKQNHVLPTSMKKAKTFLDDEYLRDLTCASDDQYFYFKCSCYQSFKKMSHPRNYKLHFV